MTADDQQPAQPATSVRNVGAIASLSPSDDPDFATVALRLFATTGEGERVLDPQAASTTLRIERDKLAAIELSVQMSLRLRQAPSGVRREAWERIAAELAPRGIQTDAEALHGSGFALVCDDELQAAQAAARR
jgi:hypothetical protein